MNTSIIHAAFRRGFLLLGAFTTATVLPNVAGAADDRVIEEVVVVGSRIQKPDYAFSNPVVSVDAESIQQSGSTDLVSYLKELPALTGSLDVNDASGPNAFIGGTGLALLNLRNLGVDRTLVLVDGRRHVAALPGSSAVDIDTIPFQLVERIEVLTGGASAIYGADGVTGVVNFVMKDDFEGLSVRTQGGRSSEGDADSLLLSVVGGKNFFDGKTNVAVGVEFGRNERLRGIDRDFASGGSRQLFARNPNDPGTYNPALDDPSIPDRLPTSNVRFDTGRGGAIDVDFDFLPDFTGDDTPWDGGVFIPPFFQIGGSGTKLDDYVGDLIGQEDRVTVNTLLNHELSDSLRLFGEVKYSRNEAYSESQPTFDFALWIEPDNAYVPTNIGNAFAGTGAPAILLARDNFDLGIRPEDITRETWRTVVGIEGDINDHFRWEASYVYGNTDVVNRNANNRINDRYAAAIDSVINPANGLPTCRSNLDPTAEPFNIFWQGWDTYTPRPGTWAGTFTPGASSGCVPINLFGDGSVSPEAMAWIMTTTQVQSELEQHVLQAYVTGDLEQWFSLPAGPIGVAAGAEYREEESDNRPSELDRGGFTFGNIIEPTKGDYDVIEAFLEVNVPLLSDLPFAREVSMDAALRLSDYSTIGTADTWKVGMVWQPILDLTFRGTVAEATRSPNIGELFDPGGQTFQFIDDPCDIGQLSNGTSFRQANCVTILTALGVNPATFTDPNAASISGSLTGNPDLEEEIADTWTVGAIIQPRFVEDLTISIDYYDIKLEQAIATAEPQVAANLCVDLPTTTNEFCNLFTREAGTGRIADFVQRPVNVAEFTSRGYDVTVDYQLDPTRIGLGEGFGMLHFRLIGNKLTDLTFVELPNADPNPDRGEEDAPEWQYVFDATWIREPFLVNYGISSFSKTQRFSKQVRASNPDIVHPAYYDYNEKFVQDLYGEYRMGSDLRLYAGVNNFTDEQPDIGETFYPVSAVGRFFYLGLTYSLDQL